MRAPAFTTIVVLILALGIGANTAIFSVVDAAMLKPMPIPDADRVVRMFGSHPQSFVWFNPRGFEVWPSFMRAVSFEAIGAYVTGELTLPGHSRGRLRAAAVTPEFFDVLKVAPQLGRTFANQDVTSGSFHLAVISHELWQTHFNGATDVLGRQIVLNRQAFVVLGIMPREFERAEVLWATLRRALVWTAAGVAVGIPLALAASRTAESLLFGLNPMDVMTLSAAAVLMLTFGALAAFIPARRASRVDPLVALRYE